MRAGGLDSAPASESATARRSARRQTVRATSMAEASGSSPGSDQSPRTPGRFSMCDTCSSRTASIPAEISGAGLRDSGAVPMADPTLNSSRWIFFNAELTSVSPQMERANPICEMSRGYLRVAADGTRESDLRDELIDRAEALDSWIGLRDANPSGQSGLAAIAPPGGNAQADLLAFLEAGFTGEATFLTGAASSGAVILDP
jgi:hypothetical protein